MQEFFKTYINDILGMNENEYFKLIDGFTKENVTIEEEDGKVVVKANTIDRQYANNKSALTGEDIKCPVCGKIFTKKQYSQAFCSTQCKDDYWNLKRGKQVDENVKYSSNVIGL